MSDDLLERLRRFGNWRNNTVLKMLHAEAADEIKSLRAELDFTENAGLSLAHRLAECEGSLAEATKQTHSDKEWNALEGGE